MTPSNSLVRHIARNKAAFLKRVAYLPSIPLLLDRCNYAATIARFAISNATDLFASAEVEQPFLDLAQQLSVPLVEQPEPGTTLHVMTSAFASGGHTRCVERWMTYVKEMRHSCILLRQYKAPPPLLQEVAEASGGKLYSLNPQESAVESALKLRRLAATFEYVVLHITMSDPIALVAFGTPAFKRPIIYFNHADHIFWLGCSIADQVADLYSIHQKLTLERRGIARSTLLGIPPDRATPRTFHTRETARQKLGLPLNQKILFTGGQAAKFIPVDDVRFTDILDAVLARDPSIHIYVAGPSCKTPGGWKALLRKWPRQVSLTGMLPYTTTFPLYLAAADLILDSYPVNGWTFVIDAIQARKPVLSLSPIGSAEFLEKGGAVCHSDREMIERAVLLLSNPVEARALQEKLFQMWQESASVERWLARYRQLIAALPKEHRIYPVTPALANLPLTPTSVATYHWLTPRINIRKALHNWLRQYWGYRSPFFFRSIGFLHKHCMPAYRLLHSCRVKQEKASAQWDFSPEKLAELLRQPIITGP